MTGIAQGLVERLGRHYVKPGVGGGVFVPEVGTNDWGSTGSRCDAIYVGFTSSSGKMLIGHEVKISRADWLHELDQPGKADFWHDNCHAWYVVAVAPGIVRPEELPAGWGLMLPNPRSRVRFDIAVKAAVREESCPSWLAVRSIMARQDTLHSAAVREARASGAAEVIEPVVGDYRKHHYLKASGSSAVDALLREFAELAVHVDRDRRSAVRLGGSTTVSELVDRIVERVTADHTTRSADVDAIVDAVADHAAVMQQTQRIRSELVQRGSHARELIAQLPPFLTEITALADACADELDDDA